VLFAVGHGSTPLGWGERPFPTLRRLSESNRGKPRVRFVGPEAIQLGELTILFTQHAHLRAAAPTGARVSLGSMAAIRTQLLRSQILSAVPQLPAMPRIDSHNAASCRDRTSPLRKPRGRHSVNGKPGRCMDKNSSTATDSCERRGGMLGQSPLNYSAKHQRTSFIIRVP
jgi:hypothetical protein